MSLVKTPEARPYSVALALRITPSISLREERKIGEEGHEPRHHTQILSVGCPQLQLWCIIHAAFSPHPSSNVEMIMTGPKDSSFAMNILSSTSVKMVGSIKNPEQKEHMNTFVCR